MCLVLKAEAAGVSPVELARLAEDRLVAPVVVLAVKAEVEIADVLASVRAPTGERLGLLADVVLGVGVTALIRDSQREELH